MYRKRHHARTEETYRMLQSSADRLSFLPAYKHNIQIKVDSHILDEDRKINAQKFDDSFYKNLGDGIDHVEKTKKEVDIDSLVNALKNDPKLMTQLIEALK